MERELAVIDNARALRAGSRIAYLRGSYLQASSPPSANYHHKHPQVISISMTNNSDDSRCDHSRPEDNPFVAFRRFADSQVSSLLNTVFTLPATIANYNNAHHAREQCLFGKADERKCAALHEIEADIAELRNEGRELFRVGDVQAVLRNSEALMKLDRRADEVRREILGDAKNTDEHHITRHNDASLVERVANEKGQEWGWEWDWGFPRPFDHDSRGSSVAPEEFDDKAWDHPVADGAKFNNYNELHPDDKPRVWTWSKSWQWPPPVNAPHIDDDAYSWRALEQNREMKKADVPWQVAYEDLVRAEQAEPPHCMSGDERKAWGRRKISITQQQSEEAIQDKPGPGCPSGMDYDTSVNHGIDGKIPITQRQLEETMDHDEEPSYSRLATYDEPSYEYSHDHEDQHDDLPTPKQDRFPDPDTVRRNTYNTILDASFERCEESETEMDAYERMDALSRGSPSASRPTSVSSAVAKRMNEAKASILSTLTTTERTVAPDGSITTKVVLKKRFADGREESSETVHTQCGQETDSQLRDPWRAFHDAQLVSAEPENKEGKKRSGWFWSS